eukprot:gene12590-biopygen12646
MPFTCRSPSFWTTASGRSLLVSDRRIRSRVHAVMPPTPCFAKSNPAASVAALAAARASPFNDGCSSRVATAGPDSPPPPAGTGCAWGSVADANLSRTGGASVLLKFTSMYLSSRSLRVTL